MLGRGRLMVELCLLRGLLAVPAVARVVVVEMLARLWLRATGASEV